MMMQFFSALTSLTVGQPQQLIRVYSTIGQSNMDGRGDPSELPTYLTGYMKNCFYWGGSGWNALTAISTSSTNQVGPIAEFAYRMQEKYPNDLHYFVFEALGGTSLAIDWNPIAGVRYAAFETKWNAAIANLSGQNYQTKGVCWMQGERDSLQLDFANAYEANQPVFIAAINSLTGSSNFIDGRIHDRLPIGVYPYTSIVRSAKDDNFIDSYSDGLINTDSFTLNTDSVHFDTDGAIQLGNAFAQYF